MVDSLANCHYGGYVCCVPCGDIDYVLLLYGQYAKLLVQWDIRDPEPPMLYHYHFLVRSTSCTLTFSWRFGILLN